MSGRRADVGSCVKRFRGIAHIAENHGFECNIADCEIDGEFCIFGFNIPTLSDVYMLCEEVGISKGFISANEEGIDVFIDDDWWEKALTEPFKGDCLWARYSE